MHKSLFCAGIGAVGSAIAAALGGWDTALQTLLIFMGVDYLSGGRVSQVQQIRKRLP